MSHPIATNYGQRGFRHFFASRAEYKKAMARAIELERKGCPRRAWRVRLNIDGVTHVKNV